MGLRLEFTGEVAGPLALGQLSHFGFGLFVPE
jgi:CRISPR-associated protein Csb2